MIGFEIEVSLPVIDTRNNRSFDGDQDLGNSPNLAIEVVTDRRGGRSNIEFVTGAISVVGNNQAAGPGQLTALLNGIRAIRTAIYGAGAVLLSTAAGNLLNMKGVGPHAQLDPHGGYVEDAGLQGRGDGLFPHYSLGAPLKALSQFFDHARTIAPYNQAAYLQHARFRLGQARAVADTGLASFDLAYPHSPAAVRSQLHGYLQLVYTQVAAMADYIARPVDQGQPKNETVTLCRSAFHEIFPSLNANVRTFLANGYRDESLVNLIANNQETTETAGEQIEFQENSTRAIMGGNWRLIQYTRSALTGQPAIPQCQIFGSMTQVAPHVEENVLMVPFELRTMGSVFKTWDGVQADLTNLTNWVVQAYAL